MTPFSQPKVLAFDVFGTVVDWHGGIVREVEALGLAVDANAFALAWRGGYRPAMQRVMRGEQGWTRIDDLHRQILDEILPRFGLQAMPEEQRHALNFAWHRLDPWPDVVAGLQRLKQRFILTTLSNGNLSLLVDLARHGGGLPWDCVLSAETFQRYKPDPATYLGVARLLDVQPAQVMLVAAHHDDLAAARACGLGTAYIERPLEFGASQIKDVSPQDGNDLHARSFLHLTELLGA
ncbi:haloacid dehalogenase type II [Ideonella azotifigens]|uniref:(S)-2-haloacid dehalogenase n=1 Tax=Ideonella azotifigens TaxID=513160 RepID=A0ABN1K160_9BURK|nr:haloacid dehalogenase type II [Ideonella azotifigens]MCD2341658.1 haloacid dehalogenase type II [Ideonella azotifigens]